jgi:PKD repeat protein
MIRKVFFVVLLLGILAGPVAAIAPDFTVDFTANVTSGMAPLAVQFVNLVTGSPVTEQWCIDNVWYNQSAGPLVIFDYPGTYDANLTVTDENNVTLTESKPGFINVTVPDTVQDFSFTGSGIFGANPVIITDMQTGRHVFIGDTRSSNVSVISSGHYMVHILSGGLTDVLNCPDYGFYLLQLQARKNIIGLAVGIALILIAFGLFRRRSSS